MSESVNQELLAALWAFVSNSHAQVHLPTECEAAELAIARAQAAQPAEPHTSEAIPTNGNCQGLSHHENYSHENDPA